jgi:hydrogenase maturation factor HypF (carbamoyltransferase family)
MSETVTVVKSAEKEIMTTNDDAVATEEANEIIVIARARGRTGTAIVKKTKTGVIVMTIGESGETFIAVTVMGETVTGAARGKKPTSPLMNA